MAERLGTDAADAGVAVLGVDDLALALVLDVRELELLAEDRGQLVEGDVDLEDVLAGAFAGLLAALPLAFAFLAPAPYGVAGIALALTGAALVLVTEAEAGDVDLRDGDGDELLPLLADQLPLRNVLS